jgi:hypothetical protein
MNTHSAEPTILKIAAAQSHRSVGRVVALAAAGWFLLLLLSSLIAG